MCKLHLKSEQKCVLSWQVEYLLLLPNLTEIYRVSHNLGKTAQYHISQSSVVFELSRMQRHTTLRLQT
jgi:hypothetical protein